MKKIAVLGGGGFIGGHMAKKLKSFGNYVVVTDIKKHEFFNHDEISDKFIIGDLRDPKVVSDSIDENIDEVYQFAADMGGAGYIFTGDNDANVMHNSALINLNVVNECCVKNVKKVFYSSSACMYPEYNQLDPKNPNCAESSAYPANPDSEYGWEKLFSERLFLAFNRNYGLNVRIARFHNIFGPQGTWDGGKEKAPAAMLRKAAETKEGEQFDVWGDGLQTRSFLFIDDCLEMVSRQMESDFVGPVNIGSEEMVTINELVEKAEKASGKKVARNHKLDAPTGVRGRNSNNALIREKLNWDYSQSLEVGIKKTYDWIEEQIKLKKN